MGAGKDAGWGVVFMFVKEFALHNKKYYSENVSEQCNMDNKY